MNGTGSLSLRHTHGESVDLERAGIRLLSYRYSPADPTYESPKPYFHPLRTLNGSLVSVYRPWDHTWHKGLQLAIAYVDDTNFWGGPTFLPEQGYIQLENNGTQTHLGFDELRCEPDIARLAQRLSWRTETGAEVLTELRRIAVRVIASDSAWLLDFHTDLRNTKGAPLVFGSPTTNGRPLAGYGGLFWRGPRDFTDGQPFSSGGRVGEQLMGERAKWAGFVGRHDEDESLSTVVFADTTTNPGYPTEWFLRSSQFAGICPAPFFSSELTLPAGDTLSLRYTVVFADGAWDEQRVTGFLAEHSDDAVLAR